MLRVALLVPSLGALAVVAGCELLVGIKDKTESTDASTADTSASPDAEAADPDVPCGQQPAGSLFCDDFDSELEAGDGWLWDLSTNGGSVGLDGVHYVSGPRSALFEIPAAPASAQLGADIGQLQTSYRLAFDLRLDVADLGSIPQIAPAQIYRTTSQDQLTIAYVVGPGPSSYMQLFEGTASSPTNVPLSELPPLRAWTRIVVAYDATDGLTVMEDGTTIGTSTAAAHGAPGSVSIIVGAVYSNSADSPVTLEIDNVVMRGE